MGVDRNKIAQALSLDELDAFVGDLASLPGRERTLEAIRRKAAARGITISLMSASSFRDTTFARHLERIRRRQEKADHIAELAGDQTGARLNDANAAILAEKIFDELNTDDDEAGDDVEPSRLDLEKMDALSKSVARLRKGDVAREEVQRRLVESQAKLREFEAREKERVEKKAALQQSLQKAEKRGGITPETRRLIDEELGAL